MTGYGCGNNVATAEASLHTTPAAYHALRKNCHSCGRFPRPPRGNSVTKRAPEFGFSHPQSYPVTPPRGT